MKKVFNIEQKEIWGVSIVPPHINKKNIKIFSGENIKKILDQSFENNWEFHFNPSIPSLSIDIGDEIWNYFISQRDAEDFQKKFKIKKYCIL